MQQAANSLALDIQAMAQLDRWLALPVGARAHMLNTLANQNPALHARVVSLAAASGSGTDSGDHGASLALAAPLLQAAQGLLTQGQQAGSVLAGWRLLRELGRGGMSVVWLAERADGSLKRQVAIKLPLAGHLSGQLSERFSRERDVLAQLAHPHIARLYDAGVGESGQPYIALEYVIGQPITQFADERHLGLRQRLQLFQQVLAAVDHAHRHLVVHRDLKPVNILVDEDGQVKLLDFGIAKLLAPPADAAELTLEASAVMTPRYAAPEQVAGGAITTSTDVYAAGVVLYELLTGLLPLGAPDASMAGLAHAVLHHQPLPPSQAAADPGLRRQLAGDIDTVLLKALRKDPAERYASVERLGEDLRRVLAHEPILARRVSLGRRLLLLAQRHRAASAVAVLASFAVLVMAGTLLLQYQASSAQRLRGDAVRDFMFDMVSDVEADENSLTGQVSGQQMLDAALQRAQGRFAPQPLVRGEVLGELGRINMRLGEEPRARQILADAIALMEQNGPNTNPALNKARAHLAHMLVYQDGASAETLARGALAQCSRSSEDCAKARFYAQGALRDLADSRSQGDAALDHARAAVREAELAFGGHDPNMVQALQAEAVVARNAGRLADAQAALDRALSSAEKSTLRASERASLRLMHGVLLLDMGRYQSASQEFQALRLTARKPDEALMLHRLSAQTLLALGQPEAALAAAQAALQSRLGEGIEPVQVLLAQLAQAHARLQLKQTQQAETELQWVAQGLLDNGIGPATPETLRAQRLLVAAAVQAGQTELAQDRLSRLLATHRNAASAAVVEHAMALDLAGCLALAQAQAGPAEGLHQRARQQLAGPLPDGHPRLLRNALFSASARWHAAPDTERRQALLVASARYRALWPPPSRWPSMLDAGSLATTTPLQTHLSICLA